MKKIVKNSLIAIFSILAIVLGILLCLFCLSISYIFINEISHKPCDIKIVVNAPTDVKVNEDFEIIIGIENLGDKKEILRDIDIPSKHFDYISLIESKPPYQETFLGAVSGDYNFRYLAEIPAKDESTIILKFKAIKKCNLKGEFNVCITTPANCFTQSLNINITE